MLRVGVAQIGSVMFDTPATLQRVEAICRSAATEGARLVVLPEALLGGYPKGLSFGATVGERTAEGREHYLRYTQAAIRCPGAETEMLASLARELDIHIVVGVVERDGGTLYCASLLISPDLGLLYKHRKLMPTGSERLIWGLGDGSTMQVVETRDCGASVWRSAGRTICRCIASICMIRRLRFGARPRWIRARFGRPVCVISLTKAAVLF